tara:strand:+ start:1234 stop:2214 length:981 start_codon:yes stop_codon:yes gene_type:complete
MGGIEFTRKPLTSRMLDHLGIKMQALRHSLQEEWHYDVLDALSDGDHPVWVAGTSGCGKDYLGEFLAYQLGMPLIQLSIKPQTDPNEWIGTTSLKGDGVGGTETEATRGRLAIAAAGFDPDEWEACESALRSGVAPFIIISDIDRARDMEAFRTAFEEKSRRYFTHPTTGEALPIHPDTIFYLTANSGIDGDGGRGNITSQLDTSIMNRCIGVYAPPPSASFEREILTGKFPQLDKAEIALLVKALRSVRALVEDLSLPYEVSLRTGNIVAKRALREKARGKTWEEGLRVAFRSVSSFCHEADNRAAIKGALDPIIGSPTIGSAKL